jgi:predicted DNA-binding helix-hairpin-helix protein
MDTRRKLELLADASRYDLSCACGTKDNDDHRRRGPGGVWLYPVALPSAGASVMLKTLLSNACVNDCRYCPFRVGRDVPRCTLESEQIARLFIELARRLGLHGLFLSSGVVRDPDHTMDRMIAVARILRRRHDYDGFLHLKIIPGASDAAVEEAVSLASAVSLNVETPTRSAFRRLAGTKDFDRDIVRPMKLISRLTAEGARHEHVCQTTQFIVGAADETDAELVTATARLYDRLGLSRVYFSAYQRGLGEPDLPGERRTPRRPEDLLTREHRLYQCDFLLRRYGFGADEIPFEAGGRLSLDLDPKELWARRHPGFFPVDVNRADRAALLRVPGFGPVTVRRILRRRRRGRLRSIGHVGPPGRRLRKAESYVTF